MKVRRAKPLRARRLNPPDSAGPVQSYGGGGFRLDDRRFAGSILLLPGRIEPWPVTALSAVTLESLAPATAIAQTLEVFLLGTGPRFEMVLPDLRGELLTAGLTVEAMDTGAACRTYNVLLAEGRVVAAALIAVD